MATQFPKIPESPATLTLSPAPLAGIFIRKALGKKAVNELPVVVHMHSRSKDGGISTATLFLFDGANASLLAAFFSRFG